MRRLMIVILLPVGLALGLFLLAAPAAAQSLRLLERISEYEVDLALSRTGTLTVTEVITVYAGGYRVRRGIFREIPTLYRGSYGRQINIRFKVLKVLRDGKPEPWHTRKRSNGQALYIGEASTLLKTGQRYTYTIVWQVERAVGFFEEADELYWNAIGHGWAFAIDSATVTVRLPPGVLPVRSDAWTGRQGRREKNVTTDTDAAGNATFTLTQPLRPREGLTILVQFPKGIVPYPGVTQRVWWFIADSPGAATGVICLLIVLLYCSVAWFIAGRDPARGTIIPRFHPPTGFSPAATRFVDRMDFDDKCLSAALVSMGVKGHLRIEQLEDDEFRLHRRSKDMKKLSPGEKAVSRKLFLFGRGSIQMIQANHTTFSGAIESLKLALIGEYEKAYFNRNKVLNWIAIGLIVVTIFAIALSGPEPFPALIFGGIFFMGTFFVMGVIDGLRVGSFKATAFSSLILLGTLIVAVVVGGTETLGLSPLAVGIIALLAIVFVMFEHLIKRPTSGGQLVMDEIEGLRMYMTVAEEDRLNQLNPPNQTAEEFERLLPYAIALGVENQWAERFTTVLREAAKGGYDPVWYTGLHGWRGYPTSFTSTLGSGMTSAIASSSTAPGSSSGGGGGGFSGGGGGGGGGGGW